MAGFLHITFGPMFSGKTTALLEKINNYLTFKNIKNNYSNVLIINSVLDTRKCNDFNLSTHMSSLKRNISSSNVRSLKTKELCDIDREFIKLFDYIAIDESQFFEDLEPFVNVWLKEGKHIHCVGLIADSEKNNFGQLHKIFALADQIEQLKVYCVYCHSFTKNAVFTKWCSSKNKSSPVEIGGSDSYVPVCGKHY